MQLSFQSSLIHWGPLFFHIHMNIWTFVFFLCSAPALLLSRFSIFTNFFIWISQILWALTVVSLRTFGRTLIYSILTCPQWTAPWDSLSVLRTTKSLGLRTTGESLIFLFCTPLLANSFRLSFLVELLRTLFSSSTCTPSLIQSFRFSPLLTIWRVIS